MKKLDEQDVADNNKGRIPRQVRFIGFKDRWASYPGCRGFGKGL
jgi:hypothetical protein